MFGKEKGWVEIKEKRWTYLGTKRYIRREYRKPDGTSVTSYGNIRWYNSWFIRLMNRNKPKDTRTIQEFMRDAGIVKVSLSVSNVTYVNTELIQKMKKEKQDNE